MYIVYDIFYINNVISVREFLSLNGHRDLYIYFPHDVIYSIRNIILVQIENDILLKPLGL